MKTKMMTLVLLAAAHVSLRPAPAPAPDANTNALPLKEVVLYSSGVGFFERGGLVEGKSQVDLRFKTTDINDLLKSMVVRDLNGGSVSVITYDSQDPIAKTLKTFAIDLTANPSLRDLLNQLRGERVKVIWPNAVTGTILGVERREEIAGPDRKEKVQIDYLNLLTDGTIQSVPIPQIQKIEIENERVKAELDQALQVLARGHDTQKKSVSLVFEGQGKREVRVAYIAQAPVWKTSYRLVLDDKTSFLQGWAIVENTSDEDWQGVQLSLVSGRPLSFVMDLYQPLYTTRPVVQPELYQSLVPQLYTDALGLEAKEAEVAKAETLSRENRLEDRLSLGRSLRIAPPAAPASALALADSAGKLRGLGQAGVRTAAAAGETGELFEYAIKTPVSIARQKSAMLPIVSENVTGDKLSIYNAAVQSKHPLNGLRLKNSTALHLMQGPITVFEDGAYAGDARLDDLAPGQDRLISYALDLKTEISSEAKEHPETIVTVRIRNGTFYATKKQTEERIYRIRNKDQKARRVLIEHPLRHDWTLELPEKTAERTRDVYRFEVNVAGAKTETLTVREARQFIEEAHVTSLQAESYEFYLRSAKVSEKVKEALRWVTAFRAEVARLTAERTRREQRIQEITQEQARIRENIARLSQNSDLYQRYVRKFDEQETQVEQLRKEIEEFKNQEATKKRELNDYLANLDLA